MNGWQAFKNDFNKVSSGLFWSVIVIVGMAYITEMFKFTCLGKVCSIVFR